MKRTTARTRKAAKRKPQARQPKPGAELLTQNQIADRFSRDRRTVAKLLEHVPPAGMNKSKRLYRVEDVKPLMAVNLRGVKSELRDEFIREQIREKRVKTDAKEGLLIPKAEVCRVLTQILPRVDQLVTQKLENEYPSVVAGLAVPQARVYGRRLRDEVMAEMNKLGAAWKH